MCICFGLKRCRSSAIHLLAVNVPYCWRSTKLQKSKQKKYKYNECISAFCWSGESEYFSHWSACIFYVNVIHNWKAVSPYLTNARLVTLSVCRRINFATFVIGKVSCVLIYLTKKHYFDLSQDAYSTKTHLSNMCLFWGMITMQITLSSRAPSSKVKLYVCTRTRFGLVAIKHRTPSHTVCVFSFNYHFI